MRTLVLALLSLPLGAFAQIGGPDTFPQFRSMSGLPGSGYGVGPDGEFDPTGAWSVSTPIAYSLAPWRFVAGLGNMSKDLAPSFNGNEGNDPLKGNATAQFLVGLPMGRYGQATYGLMVLSSKLDNAGNFTWTPPGQTGPLRIAAGVQDVSGGGGTQGEGPNGVDPGNSRSYFGVATYQAPSRVFASLGLGSNRFKGVFGNASASLTRQLKAVVEYDRFNWNWGLGFDLGKLGCSPVKGRDLGASLFLGVIRGKFAYWSVNLRF